MSLWIKSVFFSSLLGQLYEKEQKLSDAVHMYNLALEASPDMTDTQARMRTLANVPLPEERMKAGEELSWMRTVKLPKILNKLASADFDVVIAPNGKIEKVAFVAGSELLGSAANNLQDASSWRQYREAQAFISAGEAFFPVTPHAASCFTDLPDALRRFEHPTVATSEQSSSKAAAADLLPGKVLHVGGGVSAPRAIYAPEPVYSEKARKANYQGICTLGLIVETDGHPSHIRILKGLGMGLDENALEAVKSWKFEPAMRDGQPVRVEIAVEVNFHIFTRKSGNTN